MVHKRGFYAGTATNTTNRNKWIIFLGGGGACDSQGLCQDKTSHRWGTSKLLANETDASSWFIASNYPPANPDFYSWNQVLNPYCTQDFHTGQVTVASDATWGLYFSGHLVLRALLDALDKPPYNLTDATDIVLQGVSSGAVGVWTNLDYVAGRYPSARVTGLSIDGHNFYATYYTGPHALPRGFLSDFRESALPTTYALYDAFVDQTCKHAYEARGESPGPCLLSNNSLSFIESDVFVVQLLSDRATLNGHSHWPEKFMNDPQERLFLEQHARNATIALAPLMRADNPRHGVFAPACYGHSSVTNFAPLIRNTSYKQAFANFYYRETTTPPERYKLADDCGIMCNPTCIAEIVPK